MTEPDKTHQIIVKKTILIGEFGELPVEIKLALEQLFELMIKNNVTDIKMRVKKDVK